MPDENFDADDILAGFMRQINEERGPEWFLGLHETNSTNVEAFIWCMQAAYNFALSRLSEPINYDLEHVVSEIQGFYQVLGHGVLGA